ncbi:MAG: EamA family transporter [Microscillaceae bacterium]|nr:EamA family transporter [Microscillaceae bacterium]MDW8461290.1 EamA family transporter [Cytophagales bacterium]
MGYIYLIINILLTTYSQVVLKWRINMLGEFPEGWLAKSWFLLRALFDIYILSGMIATFVASIAWMAAMSKFALSYLYPFSMVSFVLVFVLSYFLFQELITWKKVIGLLLISVGVILIGLEK